MQLPWAWMIEREIDNPEPVREMVLTKAPNSRSAFSTT
jgi:hypothetical protein